MSDAEQITPNGDNAREPATDEPREKKAPVKKPTKRNDKASTKASKKSASKSQNISSSRKRMVRSFPATTFEDALVLGNAMQQIANGQKVRRLTLFDHLQKSPDSGWSRQLMINSSRYGITVGSHHTDYIEFTDDGRIATSTDIDVRQQLRARFRLAIAGIPPFSELYEQFKGQKVPAQAVMRDFLNEKGYKQDEVTECVDTFILNAKFLGLLRTIAGAERFLTLEHVLEDTPISATPFTTPSNQTSYRPPVTTYDDRSGGPVIEVLDDWSKICFYITPIGAPGSDARKHADLFLSHIVEPAVEEFKMKVVRADQIGKPGMITSQIIEHVVKARIAIADLSFHNANVFYELSLRHAFGLPTVQIIRAADPIPFDLNQVRTIQIDTTDIYTLVPQLETYKSEIANQVRRALNDTETQENPLTIFYPRLKTLQLTDGDA